MMNPADFVAIDAASAPAFSRDGNTLFHLRGASNPQLAALDLASGQTRMLTTHDEKLAFLRRAPGDDRLLYGMDRGGDERQQLRVLDGDKDHGLTDAPDALHANGVWSPDGTRVATAANDRDPAHMDVILLDAVTGAATRLWHGTHEVTVAAWHPDGTRLLAIEDRTTSDQRPVVLGLDGSVMPLPRPVPARYASLRWGPDGALWGLTDAGGLAFMALCRIDATTGTATPVWAPAGADVDAWSLSPDGRWLATVENDRGYGVLRVGPPDDPARPEVEGLPHGVVADLAWAGDSGRLACMASAPTVPPGLWCWEATTGTVRPLLVPAVPALPEFRLVEWPSFDGATVAGWLALPDGPMPAPGWPALVWVHGGPAMQARANFRPDLQSILARGIAVLVPNVRGSTGYGRAWMDADDREKRLDSVHDLAAGRNWLAAQHGIDPARIGVMGQSYGGYMVLAALTEYPALWRCAVNFYGIADFVTLLEATGPWRRAHRAAEYGDPARHRALFDRISPIHHIHRVQVPLLVLHGIRDPRVPIGESEQVVQALGEAVQYEVFDYAGHGFIRRADRERAYAAVAAFLTAQL